MHRWMRITGMLVAVLAAPTVLAGQDASSEILQTSVTTSRNVALLELELASGRSLEMGLADGIVYVGGDEVGSYDEGGFLDSAWRDLLEGIGSGDFDAAWSRFLSAEFGSEEPAAGRIAEALAPLYAEVSAEAAAVAAEAASEAAAVSVAENVAVAEMMEDVAQEIADALEEVVVGGLVVELSEIEGLAHSFETIGLTGELSRVLNGDLQTPVRVVMEADEYRLPEGAHLEEMLILVETDAVIAGSVGGNVLVADGSLLITSTGVIEGDVIGVDATVHNQGVIAGELRSLDQIASRVRIRAPTNVVVRRHHGPASFASNIGRGLGDLARTIAMYALFAFLGAIAVYFFRGHLETVSDTVSYSFGRSFLAGAAGQILFLPIAIVMAVLIITAIAVPFYIIGATLLALFGYIAVAHAAGENLTRYRFPTWASRIRRSNSYYYVLNGLGVLLALFVGAAFTQVASPILGWAHDLLVASAWILTWVASTAGLGAALLSRAGTRRTYARPREVPLDVEPLEKAS